VHLGGGGEQSIDHRDWALCAHATPLVRDRAVNRQDAVAESGIDRFQPSFQSGALTPADACVDEFSAYLRATIG
jgi:hypothetical protein